MLEKLKALFRQQGTPIATVLTDRQKPVAVAAADITPEFVQASPVFCMMPWVHLHITQQGRATPCCMAPWDEAASFGNVNEQPILDIWQGKRMGQFRTNMLAGVADERCSRCYKRERVGLYSLRQATNDFYLHHLDWVKQTLPDGTCPPSKPIYLDVRFSNLCNFKCRICGPWSSSLWHSDAKVLGWTNEPNERVTYSIESFDDFMQQFEAFFPELEEVYFAGGEPTIMAEHDAFLGRLEELGLYHVKLRYSTNFSQLTYKGKNLLERWSRFRQVFITASLDGAQARGELQRKEQSWQQTLDNLRNLRQVCPHVELLVAVTVSVFNITDFPAYHRQLVADGLINPTDIWPNVLDQPEMYNIKILAPDHKQAIARAYEEHLEWLKAQPVPSEKEKNKLFLVREIAGVTSYMQSEDWQHLQPQFKDATLKLDAVRQECTAEVIPELARYLK
jgi:radical SAM protein with 4Fe4S-binding SPASM domain